MPWSPGQFGFQRKTTASILSTLRVIQLGWAFGTNSEDMVVKSIMVRPDGFRVSPDATKMHGICNETLESDSVPLGEALQMMVTDVLKHWSNGARIVSHNLPFDAGLIYEELCWACLFQLQMDWVGAIRGGICAMDPDIGSWARNLIGLEDKSRSAPAGLKTLISVLVPDAKTVLHKHHTADGDAAMHLALCHQLVPLCAA